MLAISQRLRDGMANMKHDRRGMCETLIQSNAAIMQRQGARFDTKEFS